MRPQPILWFERFYLASIGTSILAVLYSYDLLRERSLALGGSPAAPIIGLVGLGISGWLFWFFIARQASNIAKWINVVLTGVGTLMLPWNWAEVFDIEPVYSFLAAISYLCSLIACFFLFHRDAAAWLKSKGRIAPVDPGVFS